jgi:opacity protein-like surface antigen/outer membrane protease
LLDEPAPASFLFLLLFGAQGDYLLPLLRGTGMPHGHNRFLYAGTQRRQFGKQSRAIMQADLSDSESPGAFMHKILIGVAAAAVLIARPASAADMPLKTPVVQPLPTWNWTGWYIGAHVGGGLGTTDVADPFGASIFGDAVRTPAFLGGGQVGYNWQPTNSHVVLGAEADLSALASSGTNTCLAFSGFFQSSNCQVQPNWMATLTGRVGYALGANDRSLLYIKGGASWVHDNIDITNNVGNFTPGGGTPVTTATPTTTSLGYSKIGWTVGAGIEQALTPAWSLTLEYNYLNFGSSSIATPASLWYPPLIQPFGATNTAVQQNLHVIKLGLNYKLGSDPWAGWDSALVPYPVKAAPKIASGWEAEVGSRYAYSWGRFQKDIGLFPGESPSSNVSRLTYDNMGTNSGEAFGRIDTPWNVFAKGFIGFGGTDSGEMNDEDWGIDHGGVGLAYSNTLSDKVTGNINYGVADVGYDLWRTQGQRIGAFVGYSYFHQEMNAFGCTQIANASGPCGGSTGSPTSILIIRETDTWNALRVGLAGDFMPFDRVKLSADVAYLPYVTFRGVDDHLLFTPTEIFPEWSNDGNGVQLEGMLTYFLTDRLSVGVGGRYWAMWTIGAKSNCVSNCSDTATPAPTPTPPQFFRAAAEQVGVLAQASYKFDIP